MTPYDALVEWCRDNGISCSRAANRFGHEVWSRKGVMLTFTKAISASKAEAVKVQAIRDMSMLARKPKTARARETAEKRAAALAKRRHELEEQIALRNRELDGMREFLTGDEARAIVRQIEKHERELRRMRSLMTSTPAPNAHAGNVPARHVSKQR